MSLWGITGGVPCLMGRSVPKTSTGQIFSLSGSGKTKGIVICGLTLASLAASLSLGSGAVNHQWWLPGGGVIDWS